MRNTFKLICICLVTGLLFLAVQDSCAQKADSTQATKPKPKKKIAYRSEKDSLRQKNLERDAMIRSFKRSDGSVNDLLNKIESYNSSYVETSLSLNNGFDTTDISERLPTLERRMASMRKTIETSNTMGYLITIRDMIDHLKQETKEWQVQLNGYSDQLDTVRRDIADFKSDTTLKVIPADTALMAKCLRQINTLKLKWQTLDNVSKKDIIRIGVLENRVSALAIVLIDLDNNIDARIHQFTLNALNNEAGFIWDMHTPDKQQRVDSAFAHTYSLNIKLYKYFFISRANYYGHVGCIFLLIAFFAWIVASKLKLIRTKEDHKTIFDQVRYIIKYPYATTIAVAALLAPYFYDHPAQVFTQTMLIIMMAAIGVLIKDVWPKPLYRLWGVLLVLLILFSISSLVVLTTNTERIVLILLSGLAIYEAFRVLAPLKRAPEKYPPYLSIILKAFIVINAIAIGLNVAGRFSLAKIGGSMAIFNLCLGMGFYLLLQILMEGLFLQLEANKRPDSSNIVSYLDFTVVQKKFRGVLIKIFGLLWVVALAKNLAIDDYLYDNINTFLNDPHKFNTTGFTFRNVLVFIFIIWLSGIVARIISYFYDFSAQQTKLTPQAKKTRSSILLIRLSVFVIGFFIAVSAADIPWNQITLIIGALGVGIGFGLQNLVNNLVSGIILAFEKPVQVGDVIEVSGKSGTIKEIGIRSSKISCGDGSELIVPNGDLISQHVVNWTLSDNNRRVELIIKVAYGTDVQKVDKILNDIINNHEDVMRSPKPAIFLHNFSDTAIDFRMFFWAADVGTWLSLKSSVLSRIYTRFDKEGIEIPHGKGNIELSFPEGAENEIKKAALVKKEPKKPKENPPAKDQ